MNDEEDRKSESEPAASDPPVAPQQPAVVVQPTPAPAPSPPAKPLPQRIEVAVIGGGLAGLACARALAKAGKDVHLLEASKTIGGRMRTEVHREGFRLDVGFHVLLTGYPAVSRELDIPKLNIRAFEPGCVVERRGHLHPLSDPTRGGSFREALRFPLGTLGDKLKLSRLRSREDGRTPDRTTMDHLRSIGFSSRFIDSFFVPFFGGVFLDRSLGNSSRYFQSIFRSMSSGPVGIPAEGIGAVPGQVAAGIPESAIHTECPVETLDISGDHIRGMSVAGQGIRAETVVLACGGIESARLSGLKFPEFKPLGTTVVYFTAPSPPTDERRLFVRADPDGWTNHFAVLSNIVPELAPPGRHLFMGTILGTPDLHEGAISEKVRSEMAYWFPHGLTHTWRWIGTFKVPEAQWSFPPNLRELLPKARTPVGGLYLAGDCTREPSVEGALESAREATQLILEG
jgi:phytoene dehydrogenase-like protein